MPDLTPPTRRKFLGTVATAAIAAPTAFVARPAKAAGPAGDAYTYEINLTDAEWEDRLTPEEYIILRLGGTEQRFTTDMWELEEAGTYHCRGCDLPIYESQFKTILPIGWVFFEHSISQSVMLGLDEWPSDAYGSSGMAEVRHVTEVHCRRCGSHLGHYLKVMEDPLHCINATALVFRPQSA